MRPLTFVMAIAFLFSACSRDNTTVPIDKSTAALASTGSATIPESPAGAEATEPAPSPAFGDIVLEGTGKQVVKFTTPDDAASIAVITHRGAGNLIVRSVDAAGRNTKNLVQAAGDYDGTVVFDVPQDDGEHSVAFEVDADGPWTITIKPVTSAPAWDLSGTLEGTGDTIYRIVPRSSRPALLQVSYTGDANFIVHSHGLDGPNGLVNEIGTYHGRVWMPDGSFILEVDADSGSWTVTAG